MNPELKRAYESDGRVMELLDIAKKLEGLSRHASTHAAGVVISEKPLVNYVPLQKNEESIVTQFTMNTFGSFPSRKSSLASTPQNAWMVPVLKTLQSAYDAADKGQMWRVRSTESNAIQVILANETSAAVQGQISASEALKVATQQINALTGK